MRGKGNPIEILEKTSQSEPHPSPHLRKSWKKPRNLSPVLAPTAGTPGNPGKNLTICGPSPGPPEILEKTSQFADRRRDRRKSWKKTSQYYGFAWLLLLLVGCCCWLFRQAVQRPPVGAKMCGAKEILVKNVRDKGNPIGKCAGQRKSY